MKNEPYGIRRAAEPCIKGNAQLKSFVRSPHVTGVCNVLQDRGEASGAFSLAGLREVVSGLGGMASADFQAFRGADLDVCTLQALRRVYVEHRGEALPPTRNMMKKAANLSNRVFPQDPGQQFWLHGPLERRPEDLQFQAADVVWWLAQDSVSFLEPKLEGLTFKPKVLAKAMGAVAAKLGNALDSIDDIDLRLGSARKLRNEAYKNCKNSYVGVSKILEGLFTVRGLQEVFKSFGPSSMRVLERGCSGYKKVKEAEKEEVKEQAESQQELPTPSESQPESLPEVSLQSDSPIESSSEPTQESDLPTDHGSKTAQESDLQTQGRLNCNCEGSLSPTNRLRRLQRRGLSVTRRVVRRRGGPLAVANGFPGPRESHLAVTSPLRGSGGRLSTVTRAIGSSENRGEGPKQGVTARIRSFFSRSLRK